MAKKMLIDATHAEETRVVVVDGNKVEEFDFESENKRQLAGNIYLAKVTRRTLVTGGFVEYGGNRHGFFAFSEIHPIITKFVADREALMAEEMAYADCKVILKTVMTKKNLERDPPLVGREHSPQDPKMQFNVKTLSHQIRRVWRPLT